MSTLVRFALVLVVSAFLPLVSLAQKEHGFDNTKPSGQPYLTPAESLKRMKVADGFEVKLFAAEPMVINPIAFTIDEKGRAWVVESFEYPKRTPPGKMPRDRIVILEDTDGDGVADKRTVFAEGKDFPVRFDMASGIEVYGNGCILGAPPYLFRLEDTKGTGKADKFEILLKGFGSEDTHETLNSFTWGPDGWLYGLHGIFTNSQVQGPNAKDGDGVKMNAAVWRYHPRTREFEIFAEGTSNPWGMDFDSNGNCFICCCVIPHLFHIIPGGIYRRQAGASYHPYAYGELKEICDHTFHKESGWAHAGLLCLDNPCVPEEYRTSVIFGSIHGCSLKRNVLKRNGSTFTASRADDFLVSGDKNFRPITLRWGPNGSIYVSDWHDQNPCHQAKPEDWDYERGRIYRIQWKGLFRPSSGRKGDFRFDRGTENALPPDLRRMSLKEQLEAVRDPRNSWLSRNALRLLGERGESLPVRTDEELSELFPSGLPSWRQRRLWGLHQTNFVPERLRGIKQKSRVGYDEFGLGLYENERRTEVQLFMPQWLQRPDAREWLKQLIAAEQFPSVRREMISVLYRYPATTTSDLLHPLLVRNEDATDPVIPFMLWLAYEPKLAANVSAEMAWLQAHAPGNPLLTQHIVSRAMRRLVATGKAADLAACIAFVQAVTEPEVRRQALRGLLEAFKQRQFTPPPNWAGTYAVLKEQPQEDIRRMSDQLAAHFRDRAVLEKALRTLRDPQQPLTRRHDAITTVALAKPPDGPEVLLLVLKNDPVLELRQAAANALSGFESSDIGRQIVTGWKNYPPALRVECINTLKGRRLWARHLMEAVGRGEVPRTDLTDQTILAMSNFRDPYLQELIEKVWGRFRATPAELEQLIAKLRQEMDQGTADFARGKLVFEKNCAQCHRFQGQGHEVGPNLDGAERSIEYLLTNVLDPNRVIGLPYFTRVVLRKNGTIVTGLVHAEDGQTVTLKRENNVLEVIPRADIEEMKTEQKSLMPEGLGNNMTPQDFRDLVRYLMANPFITEVRVWQDEGMGFSNLSAAAQAEPWKLKDTRITSTILKTGTAGRLRFRQANTTRADTGEPTWFQYVEVAIQAPATLQTRLMLGTNGPAAFKVWVNGKLLQEGKELRKEVIAAPDQRVIPLTLQPGMNRLVVRYGNSHKEPTLYLRVLDVEQKLKFTVPKE